MSKRMMLNYPLFDGEKVIEKACVVIENGIITAVEETETVASNYFLVPGLIDAHTHMSTREHIKAMLENGVTATCDVSASATLIENAKPFTIISSAGMTMGTLNGKAYVKKTVEGGAKYIKVMLTEPNLMPKFVLKEICKTAHINSLKVAVHATSVKAVKMSVACGADILIHIPAKEALPEELGNLIAQKGIAVIPTLVMMKTFADSGRNGYKQSDFGIAESNVGLLYKNGVKILAGTDANTGSFAPAVAYGSSMHCEMELLAKAGMKTEEVLKAATSSVADVFGLKNTGRISVGQKAEFLVIEGRPDKDISDSKKIKQVWAIHDIG